MILSSKKCANGSLLALLSLLLAVPIFSWPALGIPLERDEGEYAYAADVLARGGLPYRDVFLQKPPGIVFVYRTIFFTIGSTNLAIRACLIAAFVAVVYLLYALGCRISGE